MSLSEHISAPCAAAHSSRRVFLRGLGTLLLTPGLVLMASPGHSSTDKGPNSGPNSSKRWGLLVDTRLCTADCTACVDACVKEHGLKGHGRPATDPQWIRKLRISDPSTGHESHVPLMCQHCGQAPCVEVCPTGATLRRKDGIVLVNRHLCIGCRYCVMACPFKARFFVHEDVEAPQSHSPRGKGSVEGCTLCVHRIDAGRAPACVEACAKSGHGAMVFGDLNDPTSAITRRVVAFATVSLRPDLRVDPGVRYQGVSL